MLAGIAAAFVAEFAKSDPARAAWDQIQDLLSLRGKPKPASPAILSGYELEKLDGMSPQRQAEILLERAVNHYQGSNDQIAERVDRWRGKIKLTPKLNALAVAAINSNDLRVRAAALEIDLAAYGLPKTSATIDQLERQASSANQATRIWALWALGLMANRGVETERVTQFLIARLSDPNEEIRHWAVEGLAYVGTDETIPPLMKTFRDDPSQLVRERAACSLAQSGMLTQEQRADDRASTSGLGRRHVARSRDTRLYLSRAPGHHRAKNPGRRHSLAHLVHHNSLAIPGSRRFFYSSIFATCTSNPVFGNRDVSSNTLYPSPEISV